ncbi:hypothetical protein D3C71_2076370 [compost metagenome]
MFQHDEQGVGYIFIVIEEISRIIATSIRKADEWLRQPCADILLSPYTGGLHIVDATICCHTD